MVHLFGMLAVAIATGRSWRRRGQAAAAVACMLATVGCSTAPPAHRILTLAEIRELSAPQPAAVVNQYPIALAVVIGILEGELGFPELDVAVEFYRDRAGVEAALVESGLAPEMAHQLSTLLDGVTLPGRILVNEQALKLLSWSARVRFLAHELTHVVQNQLAGDRRSRSPQWMREGFAEWVSWQVAEVLAPGSFAVKRRAARRQVAVASAKGRLIPLSRLVTAADFFADASRQVVPLYYLHSFLAVDLLVDRHGVPAMLEYFAGFAGSDQRDRIFEGVFDQTPGAFEREFAATVAALPLPERRSRPHSFPARSGVWGPVP